MFPNNQKIHARVREISNRIAKFDEANGWELFRRVYEKEVHNKKNGDFYSYHNSLELAFLLLNDKNIISKIFWHSYALTYQASNNTYNKDFGVDDFVNIIKLLEKNSKKNKKYLTSAKKFENLIVQNGFLRKFSKNHIEFLPSIDTWKNFGAVGILSVNHKSINELIKHGKALLTKIIFNIYGIKVSSGYGLQNYSEAFVSNNDIEYLIKKDLIKPANNRLKNNLKSLISKDWNNSYREYINVYVHSAELIDRIDYAGEIENDFESIIGFYGIFESLNSYKYFDAGFEEELPYGSFGWGDLVCKTAIHAIDILRELVSSRYDVFGVAGIAFPRDVAIIAGLSNPFSVINAINNGEIKDDKENKFRGLNLSSVRKWVLDNKRKFKVYEPIENVKPDKDIDYAYILGEVEKVRTIIKELKKNKFIFNDNDKFIRTNKKIFGRVADQNKKRWEWIGKGKTFKQLNAKNSTYRKNIRRQTYKKHTSPITQDILYDLKSGYIEKIK